MHRSLGWHRSHALFSAGISLLVLVGAACGNKARDAGPVAPANPGVGAGHTEPVPLAVLAPAPVFEDGTFRLATTVRAFAAGVESSFAVTLIAKPPYHVNQEFPMTIDVSGPAEVELTTPHLERASAKEFGESSARFEVPARPRSAGVHELLAKVSFAVCTPETCVPDERTLRVTLNAAPSAPPAAGPTPSGSTN